MPIKSKPIPSAGYVYPVTFEHSTMDNWYQTEKAEQGFKYATSLVKPILTFLGVWPLPLDSHLSSKIIQKIVQFVTYFLFLFWLVPYFLYVVLKENNPKVRMKMIGSLIMCIMQLIKYTIVLLRMKEVRQSLNTVKRDWYTATENNRLIFLKTAKEGKRIVMIVAVTIYGGGLSYRLVPIIRGSITLADNTTIRLLPLPSYYVIFDAQQSPIYEIICVMQFLGGFVLYSTTTGTTGISVLLTLHACCLLRILANKMNQLSENENMPEHEVQQRIVDIVDYQWNIKRFLNDVQRVLEYICLIEMVGGTILICLGVYYILVDLADHNTASMIIFFTLGLCCAFCIFILCYVGQLLLNESQIVSRTSCTLDWYRLSVKHARSLILVIVMSNYPMRLTAGKMTEMSLATFTDICKLSMGYLNVLRETITNDKL
ncbi:odorant receptor 22c-like isoform X1 [Ceratina calcarata]|uniref:Odorant receptor n=1 Tax=Ceratina calcarata TaxID=156304 RepID=A0AAJ7IWS2_9HYME|nr:odorant receptor 22c-like isoform X1 [Ceratina calcarata]